MWSFFKNIDIDYVLYYIIFGSEELDIFNFTKLLKNMHIENDQKTKFVF